MIRKVTQDEFNALIKEKKLVITEFTTPNCNACKSYMKLLDTKVNPMIRDMKDVELICVDIKNNTEIRNTFKIQSVPTTMFFVKGRKMTFNNGQDRFAGLLSDIHIKIEKILKYLNSL